MPFLPQFEDDIFISYADIDDRPLTAGKRGWISNFDEALTVRLTQLLGEEPKVWRAPGSRGNPANRSELESIPEVGIFVSVVSPSYVTSQTCLKQVRQFREAAERNGGLRVGDSPRIFKVVKLPVVRDRQPAEILDLLDYEFYHTDKTTDRPHELNPEVNPGITQNYCLKLDDLAYDIHKLLEKLRTEHNGKAARVIEEEDEQSEKKQVFLSHSSVDAETAEKICDLLESQGINCWIAPRDVAPVSEYAIEVSNAIENTAAMVLVLSSHSNASVHVTNEVEFATSHGKPVFTVRIEDVLPSKRLAIHISVRQWVNAWTTPMDEKIGRLAAGIREEINLPGPEESVYLAETTFDLKEERDSIRRELQQRGYTVLPDKSLPSEAENFRRVIREYLQRSRLSIHLVGDNYGDTPKGAAESLVYLQNELAAERADDLAFSRLIWIPPGVTGRDEKQQRFIDGLQHDLIGHQRLELLQTSLQELKSFIQETLTNHKPPPPEVSPDGPLHIYLICDQQDIPAVLPLRDYLFRMGYEAVLPAMTGEEAQIREDHRENLVLCDACLIYYGAANEFWLRSKLRDLQKSAGYGRTGPMLAKAVYVTGPETPDKVNFHTLDASVIIKNFGPFRPDVLQPFLATFARAQSVKGGRQ